MHYSDLNALLHSEPEARRYFDTLPDYAREQIQTRAGNVNSFASLKDYAENLSTQLYKPAIKLYVPFTDFLIAQHIPEELYPFAVP